jgi:hypothetical protein
VIANKAFVFHLSWTVGMFDYASEEAVARIIEDTDEREKLVVALMVFFEEYRLKMKNKESNILKERENLL